MSNLTENQKLNVPIGDPEEKLKNKRITDSSWLQEWRELDSEIKNKTKEQVREILRLKARVLRNEYPSTYKPENCNMALEEAGRHLAEGGIGEIASALIETVNDRLEDEQKYWENRRRRYFSGKAVQMLFIGLVVQGVIILGIFYSLRFFDAGLPEEIFGIKTLTIISVVISSIAGSLARVVHESQSGKADEATLNNLLSMAATSLARPLLAAVLALFVFSLFQAGLIGIPFESSGTISLNDFAREDYFFVAIAFVIGFNDTLGLNLLTFVGKYLPEQNKTNLSSTDKTSNNKETKS